MVCARKRKLRLKSMMAEASIKLVNEIYSRFNLKSAAVQKNFADLLTKIIIIIAQFESGFPSSVGVTELTSVLMIQCSDSALYPHKSLSMLPLPPCLTIQFYSSNQLIFPVIIPISSSSIHLLASFTINLPLLFLFDEFGNFICLLFPYINMHFISIS